MIKEKCIIAKFIPQAWINNSAVDVDTEGETTQNVTDYVINLSKNNRLLIKDNHDSSDNLKNNTNAPEWIKNWNGPFYIEVTDSINKYFGEI